jgi:hypothetical protein
MCTHDVYRPALLKLSKKRERPAGQLGRAKGAESYFALWLESRHAAAWQQHIRSLALASQRRSRPRSARKANERTSSPFSQKECNVQSFNEKDDELERCCCWCWCRLAAIQLVGCDRRRDRNLSGNSRPLSLSIPRGWKLGSFIDCASSPLDSIIIGRYYAAENNSGEEFQSKSPATGAIHSSILYRRAIMIDASSINSVISVNSHWRTTVPLYHIGGEEIKSLCLTDRPCPR